MTPFDLYLEHEAVAVHPRLFKPGDYSTQVEHLPPNAQAFLTQDADWCLEKSKHIGEHTEKVVQRLLNDPSVDLLRAAQGIIKLCKHYGQKRLEAACQRALHFTAPNYKTIRSILKNGLDYHRVDEAGAFEQLGSVYEGKGVYQRARGSLVH